VLVISTPTPLVTPPAITSPVLRPRRSLWVLLVRNREARIGLIVLVILAGLTLSANAIAPHDPLAIAVGGRLEPPSLQFPFGTDQLGRDLLSRTIFGARISLYVAVAAVSLAVTIGVPFGTLSGLAGGLVDDVCMRSVDVLFAFPSFLLALVVITVLGPGLNNAMLAVGIIYAPQFARLARAAVLEQRDREYVHAAVVCGASPLRVVVSHVLPNASAPLIVQTSLSLSLAVLTEASLGFLGLGTRPPTPSWGAMLLDGYGSMELAPWLAIVPGLAIMLTVLGLNLLGDGVRDVLDPHLQYLQRGAP
jgi:peptide/nickel transport system permease protein